MLNISETLNNSGMKMIQHVQGRLAHYLAKYVLISWLDLYLRLTETFWRASLVQEQSQSTNFAGSTEITAMICNVFSD